MRKCIATGIYAIAGLAIADGASSAAHAQSATSIEFYGFAMADAIYDTHRLDPAWDDAFRPSKIPTDSTQFGGDGQSSISVKQSRFGAQGTVPVANSSPINFKFEIDFFGVGVDAGQTT